MRFLLVLVAALALALPLPAWARPCSEVGGSVSFGVEPREVDVGESNLFRLRFRFNEACEAGTTLRFEVHDVYQSTDYVVRERDYPMSATYRDAAEDSFDFRESWIQSSGQHAFTARILLDGRQITASSAVIVTATGGPEPDSTPSTGGVATTTGAQAGPVDLAVAIGSLVRAESIAQYIAAVYGWAIGIAVTLSMVMVVVGGFQYVVARGNPGAIGAAKSRIANAVIGLVLALGSYTILNTINPQLVQLRNLTIPPITRSETIGNRCEELDRTRFRISPSSGSCGQEGTVTASDGTEVATPQCTWGVCSRDGEVCVRRGSAGFGCVQCGDVIDDNLTSWGYSEDDAGCGRFAPPERGGNVRDCIFSQHNGFDINDDVCAYVFIDCAAVERCGDYDSAITAAHGGDEIPLDRMAVDAVIATSRETIDDAFEGYCNANPCAAQPGSCHAEFSGSNWNCMEGPASAGGGS